jgi:hypothetical protein
MIAKTISGKNAGGCLKYVFDSKKGERDEEGRPAQRGEIVGGNMAGQNAQELKKEFDAATGLKPNISKPITHHVLTFSPEDHKKLDMSGMVKVADDYMKQRGYGNSMYAVVAHRDTANTHLHIVASKIDLKGKVISEWQSKKKDFAVCRDLEKQYGLRELADKPRAAERAPSREEIGYKERTGNLTVRETIQNAVEKSLVEKNFPVQSPDEFIKRVESQGVAVKTHLDKNDKIVGMSFAKESPEGKTIAFKGADLGEKYNWKNLSEKVIGLPEKKDPPSLAAGRGQSDFQKGDENFVPTIQEANVFPAATEKDKAIADKILSSFNKILDRQSITPSKEALSSFEKDLTEVFNHQRATDNQLKILEKWQPEQPSGQPADMTRLEAVEKLLDVADSRQQENIVRATMERYEQQVKDAARKREMEKLNYEKDHNFSR